MKHFTRQNGIQLGWKNGYILYQILLKYLHDTIKYKLSLTVASVCRSKFGGKEANMWIFCYNKTATKYVLQSFRVY